MADQQFIRGHRAYEDVPPLRDDAFEPDGFDADRVEWVRRVWDSQNGLLRERDRLIEHNIRMLVGQQWSVWNDMLGRWVDVSRYLSDDERRWRYLPTVNRILHWFMLIHARMNENPPILTFTPATGDQEDAELAEVLNELFKHLWHEANMLEVADRMFSWLIPCGRAFIKSRIDPLKGDPLEFRGPAMLELMDPSGQALGIERLVNDVPFNEQGVPQASLTVGHDPEFGDPFVQHEGGIVVDVHSPLEIRGEWGPNPWWDKSWHIQKSLLTPEQVYDTFGVHVEPNIYGADADEGKELKRMLFGAGFWSAATGRHRWWATSGEGHDKNHYVETFELWSRPSRFPGTERTQSSPGGRLAIICGDKVMRDGPRFADFKYTSPIRSFDFVAAPGRPSGTSPQEMLNGPQKAYNRVYGQILQHTTLVANPIRLVDLDSGIQEGQITNKPGQTVHAQMSGLAGDPIRFARPPELTRDVHRTIEMLHSDMGELGNIQGAEGRAPTSDASGELVKELRFNSDRFIGPTLRRAVPVFGRMAEDWKVMIPLIWDQPKVIRVAGDRLAATTLTVYPKLFERGKVNVIPELESMLPEGRGERQARVWKMWMDGAFGDPMMPEARDTYLELARFPHMGRATRPGGVDRETAEQDVALLVQGHDAMSILPYEWYDHGIHLYVVERYMKSPAYRRLEPFKQTQFYIHRQHLLMAQANALVTRAGLEGQVQQAAFVAAGGDPAAPAEAIAPGPPDRGPTASIPSAASA